MAASEIIKTLRPKQWIKNLFVFAPLVFSVQFLNPPAVLAAIQAFLSFCLVSGALYTLNDLFDIEEDRRHPIKSNRPLASGRLKKQTAIITLIISGLAGLALAFTLNLPFLLIILGYIILQLLYSPWLKHVVIIDIFVVAAGFLLRVIAGAVAIRVAISSWLLICTTLLALFLSMTKRRHEYFLLPGEAAAHRPVLNEYSPYLLDQMISVVTASTLIAYCLYTVSEETIAKFQTRNLILTTPFVLYGIFRYLYLVHQKNQGSTPEELVIKDKPLLFDIILWIISVAVILYFR
ncbi:MAG TPA: decaprenyl-phosphate phosphoribosyltransferase [Candidatus Saccharicenans sp.]|nr:decaprenyl-phosphate phosphoribosyltransferase [Candidatus Saccharicenans sp.]HQM75176.1 decaprenyl-phosphate phosphoribosyltransferase [Candidatus Saccharicenans sp.]